MRVAIICDQLERMKTERTKKNKYKRKHIKKNCLKKICSTHNCTFGLEWQPKCHDSREWTLPRQTILVRNDFAIRNSDLYIPKCLCNGNMLELGDYNFIEHSIFKCVLFRSWWIECNMRLCCCCFFFRS